MQFWNVFCYNWCLKCQIKVHCIIKQWSTLLFRKMLQNANFLHKNDAFRKLKFSLHVIEKYIEIFFDLILSHLLFRYDIPVSNQTYHNSSTNINTTSTTKHLWLFFAEKNCIQQDTLKTECSKGNEGKTGTSTWLFMYDVYFFCMTRVARPRISLDQIVFIPMYSQMVLNQRR